MARNIEIRTSKSALSQAQILILTLAVLLVCGLWALVLYFYLHQPKTETALAQTNTPAAQAQSQATRPVAKRPTGTPVATETLRPSPTPPPTHTPTVTPLPPPEACVPQDSEFQLGLVTSVIDGDTIEVEIDGQRVLVGYAGITAPPDSLQKNMQLSAGEVVALIKDGPEQDERGRKLRYVLAQTGTGSYFVNFELVRQGYALANDAPELICAAVLKAAESMAKAEKLAMWSPTPIPTRTFIPTVGANVGQGACNCSVKWTCSNFSTHDQAQACFNACNDYNSLLDEDHDGLACEGLP